MAERDEFQTTEEADAKVEAAVLRLLLDLHPVGVTSGELLRELGGDPGEFAARDAVERAVRDLAASGLLHRGGGLLQPSRAALRCAELLGF